MSQIEIKRGDTLLLDCVVQGRSGPMDIAGWQIECWLRTASGQLVHRFTPEIVDAAAGAWRLRADAEQTRRWPAGLLQSDVRYTDAGGSVMTTATFPVTVIERVTGP